MSKADDKQVAIAQVYSRAIHGLAVAKGEADELASELADLSAYVEDHADLSTFFESPLIDPGDRAGTLEKMFRGRVSDLLLNSLQVVNRKGRLGLLGAIADSYHAMHREHQGQVDVHVSTAVPLGSALRDRLVSVLGKYSGRQPQLVEEVDPSLIGGIVLKVDDEKIDASVIHEIDRLRRTLRERSEHEIHCARRAASEAAG